MNKEDTIEILSILENDPVLARRLANIVCSQLDVHGDAGVRIDPAMDDEEVLVAIHPNQDNLVTIDESGIRVDNPHETTVVGFPNPLNIENYHLPDDVRIDAKLFECEW